MIGTIVSIRSKPFLVLACDASGMAVVPIVAASNTQRAGEVEIQGLVPGIRFPVARCGAAFIAPSAEPTGFRVSVADLVTCRNAAANAARERAFTETRDGLSAWHQMAREEKSVCR